MDMTPGDFLYRLVVGRDPPWNSDASKSVVPQRVYRRPERLIEWLHTINPLKIRFCACGLLREVAWSRGYICRILYPKNQVLCVGVCPACGDLAKYGLSNGHQHPGQQVQS
jgi:hypothetical protein